MKNLYAVIAALTLVIGMTSCSQEDVMEQAEAETPKAPVKVQAVTEDAAATRTTYDRDDNYRVLWSEGDKIKFVNQDDTSVVYYFTLSSEAGQPNGEFTLDAGQADLADGEYMVLYPATWRGPEWDGVTVKSWPQQTFKRHAPNDISGAPMRATATVSNGGTTVSKLEFTNVGAIVSYLALMDFDKPLCNVNIKATGWGDRPEVITAIDCKGVNARNMDIEFSIKPGYYTSVTLEYNAMDGSKAVKKADNMNIERSKFYRAIFNDLTFGEPVKIVDMGLGIKIADRNFGAGKPEEWGENYCWGETELKNRYLRDDIAYTDCPGRLPLEKDAVNANWGGNWRMPTVVDFNMLRQIADWTWTENYNETGVAGYIVKSKETGKSIFMPQAYSTFTDGFWRYGVYWTSDSYTDPSRAKAFSFGTMEFIDELRSRGLPIRPVWKED